MRLDDMKRSTGVLCNKRIPITLKDKFYRNVAGLPMLKESKCLAIKREIEQKMREMRMLRRTSHIWRVTRVDRQKGEGRENRSGHENERRGKKR